MTLQGKLSLFPTFSTFDYPYGITAGPDGNLWFTEVDESANKIGRITTH